MEHFHENERRFGYEKVRGIGKEEGVGKVRGGLLGYSREKSERERL